MPAVTKPNKTALTGAASSASADSADSHFYTSPLAISYSSKVVRTTDPSLQNPLRNTITQQVNYCYCCLQGGFLKLDAGNKKKQRSWGHFPQTAGAPRTPDPRPPKPGTSLRWCIPLWGARPAGTRSSHSRQPREAKRPWHHCRGKRLTCPSTRGDGAVTAADKK